MSPLLWSLLLFVAIAVGTPGANNLLAASSGARFGLRRSAGLLIGIWVAVVSVAALSALGLGSVVSSRRGLQIALRAAGSVYLIWLAYRIGRSGRPPLGESELTRPPGFRAGVVVTCLNPKAWTVALSAAAGYSAISRNPLTLSAVFATTFAVVLVPNLLLWCRGGEYLARTLQSDRQWRVLNLTLAMALAASVIPMWTE